MFYHSVVSSTEILKTLPGIEDLRRRCQALATLDSILCPEWEYRYFSFNASWAPGEALSSMRNGEGDDWLILFNPEGVIVKGFVLASKMAEGCPWPGVVDTVPEEFSGFVDEPAFAIDKTTFCLWRRSSDPSWNAGAVDHPAGPDADGALKLLRFLDGEPATYQEWGEEYYGTRLNPRAIEQVYSHEQLTEFLVRSLNPKAKLRLLRAEIEDIDYPMKS